jgi:3-oxoacyl-[acyl-carrier-protein] synthase III
MSTAAVVAGLGTALPPHLVSNNDLSQHLATSDEWIRSRTGIKQRYWSKQQSTGDLAVEAASRALKSAGSTQADLVILATTTPDHPCPATAPDVAARLGLGHVAAYDLSAVCSGFIYALAAADAHIRTGHAHSALVIGAETYSTILDPDDRSTSVIFGDGAGAVLLAAGAEDDPGALQGTDLGSDGTGKDLIMIPGGGSRERTAAPDTSAGAYFTMQGKAVFRQAVTRMAASARTALNRAGWTPDSVRHFVGHQANLRILHAVSDELALPRDRVVVDLDRVGNTSSASIPLALSQARSNGVLKTGDRVLLSAFGGGLTWGSTALVWPEVDAA